MFQGTLDEMRQQEEDFQVQMKEQCEDYKELLSEKMAREMEITAYRSDSHADGFCVKLLYNNLAFQFRAQLMINGSLEAYKCTL